MVHGYVLPQLLYTMLNVQCQCMCTIKIWGGVKRAVGVQFNISTCSYPCIKVNGGRTETRTRRHLSDESAFPTESTDFFSLTP